MSETEKLGSAEKMAIKQLMQESGWESVLKFFAIKVNQWNGEKVTGANEFETLKTLHTNQGKVEGLEEFMNQMEAQAFE